MIVKSWQIDSLLKYWNQKAKTRKLLKEEQYLYILSELQILPKEINQLIKFTNMRLND